MGDIQFGANEDDPNRFILLVQRNYIPRSVHDPEEQEIPAR